MANPKRKGGRKGHGGARKHGRDKVKCALYRARKRRERNKIRKLTRLLKLQPKNAQIPKAIEKWKLDL